MPELECNHERMANAASFRISSPPIRPSTARPRSVEEGNEPSASTMPKRGSGNLTVELGQASLDRLERLEVFLDDIAARLVQVQEQQGGMSAALTELRDLLV